MTILNYTATAGQTEFSFASMEFDASLSTVIVTLDDALYPLSEAEVDYDTKLITFNNGLVEGTVVRIFRTTAVGTAAVTYVDTAVLTDDDLNTMSNQLLYRLQELIEQIDSNYDPLQVEYGNNITDNTQRLDLIEADSWVSTLRIADNAVTRDKIEEIDDMRLVGNTSGGVSSPTSIIKLLDEDGLTSGSTKDVPSQYSVKEYVDAETINSNDHDLRDQSGVIINSAAVPSIWTEYDLSLYVGGQRALVWLQIDSESNTLDMYVRPKGLTRDIGAAAANGGGLTQSRTHNGNTSYISVFTDSDGKIEMKSGFAYVATVTLIGSQAVRL